MTVIEEGLEIACRWFEGAAVKERTLLAHALASARQPEHTDAEA
jgi:uncharacterized protein YodC (DUF2158 family)